MDGSVLALFLISTFLGGLTSGLAGFAAGLVVSGVWLHILTPTQTAVQKKPAKTLASGERLRTSAKKSAARTHVSTP